MTEVKKGRKSWKPAARLTVHNVPDGYVARWVDKEQGNYQKRRADGYVPVSKATTSQVTHDHPDLTGDGKPLTSVVEYRDMQLMMIPKEDYEAHRDYYNEQTKLQTASLKRNAMKENADNAGGRDAANVYGKIVIE